MLKKEIFIRNALQSLPIQEDYAEYLFQIYGFINSTPEDKANNIAFLEEWSDKTIDVNGVQGLAPISFLYGTLQGIVLSSADVKRLNERNKNRLLKKILKN